MGEGERQGVLIDARKLRLVLEDGAEHARTPVARRVAKMAEHLRRVPGGIGALGGEGGLLDERGSSFAQRRGDTIGHAFKHGDKLVGGGVWHGQSPPDWYANACR